MTAVLASGLAAPTPFVLDGPLFAACIRDEAMRRDCDPEDMERIDAREVLPLVIERSGMYWISRCSDAEYTVAARDVAHWSKRTDIDTYLEVGARDRAVSLKSDRYRNHRQPLYLEVTDRVVWHCVGDGGRVRELLGLIGGLGKKRAVGFGAVANWEVESDDGDWSLARPDGSLARPIPLRHKRFGELIDATRTMEVAPNPPYWSRHNDAICAMEGRWKSGSAAAI